MSELPQKTIKGLTFFPIPEFTDVDLAFGANENKFFGKRDLPEIPREYIRKANELFFQGGKLEGLSPKVDKELAYRAVSAWLKSFAPSHEGKEATVGYALWLWSTDEAL